MQPLTRKQFRDALYKGHGRAWLHLHRFGPEGMQDLIEEACLHNLVYDYQTDGDRADWIGGLIELSGCKEQLQDRILVALPSATNNADRALLFSLALAFAKAGYEPARLAMYDAYGQQPHTFLHIGGLHLVELDGLPGFVRVAEVIGRWLLQEPEYRAKLIKTGNNHWLLGDVEQDLGRSAMLAALQEQAPDNVSIQAYLEFFRDWLESNEENPRVSRSRPWDNSPLAAKDFIAAIDSLAWERINHYRRAIRRVDPAGVDQIFERMLQERRPEQLRRYLRVFASHPIPRLAPQLFDWTDSTEEGISEAAYAVLAQVAGPHVREFLLDRLRQTEANIRPGVLELFAAIYQPGDETLLIGQPIVCMDDNETHSLVLDIRTLWDKHPLSGFVPLLLWAYEHSPCGHCRENVVKNLIQLDYAPKKLLDECRWDSNEETRKLALS